MLLEWFMTLARAARWLILHWTIWLPHDASRSWEPKMMAKMKLQLAHWLNCIHKEPKLKTINTRMQNFYISWRASSSSLCSWERRTTMNAVKRRLQWTTSTASTWSEVYEHCRVWQFIVLFSSRFALLFSLSFARLLCPRLILVQFRCTSSPPPLRLQLRHAYVLRADLHSLPRAADIELLALASHCQPLRIAFFFPLVRVVFWCVAIDEWR